MEKELKIDYLELSDIYELQDKTGIQIIFGDIIDKKSFSEAVRVLIRRE